MEGERVDTKAEADSGQTLAPSSDVPAFPLAERFPSQHSDRWQSSSKTGWRDFFFSPLSWPRREFKERDKVNDPFVSSLVDSEPHVPDPPVTNQPERIPFLLTALVQPRLCSIGFLSSSCVTVPFGNPGVP